MFVLFPVGFTGLSAGTFPPHATSPITADAALAATFPLTPMVDLLLLFLPEPHRVRASSLADARQEHHFLRALDAERPVGIEHRHWPARRILGDDGAIRVLDAGVEILNPAVGDREEAIA